MVTNITEITEKYGHLTYKEMRFILFFSFFFYKKHFIHVHFLTFHYRKQHSWLELASSIQNSIYIFFFKRKLCRKLWIFGLDTFMLELLAELSAWQIMKSYHLTRRPICGAMSSPASSCSLSTGHIQVVATLRHQILPADSLSSYRNTVRVVHYSNN